MIGALSIWRLRDSLYGDRSLLRARMASVLHLLSGSTGNTLIMLASTAIAARALHPEAFGAMALVLTIGRVSERLVRFESWQPLIRFVAEEEENASNAERIAELYLFGLLLDIAAALLAAILAITAALVLSDMLGLGQSGVTLVAIYACAIAVNIRGMPSAAFRLAGRFKTLAYLQLLANTIRVVLAVICYLADLGLMAFIIVWTAAQMLDSLLFTYLGFRVLRQAGTPSPLRANWRGLRRKFPGFLAFSFSTNLSSMLRTLTHEADTLLVGAFAGTAAAGLYHLAKRMAKMAQQVGDLIQTVVYPDLARLWAQTNLASFRRLVVTVQALLFAIGASVFVLLWLAGKPLVALIFGHGYDGIYPLLLAQTIAVALIMHSAPSRSALLAMNRPQYVLAVAIASTVTFFTTALLLMPQMGVIGANVAHIAYGALTTVLLDYAFWRGKANPQVRNLAAKATGEAAP